nr:hypothetical protein Iba_chr04aCG15800 [Ipomoea batatas]GMC82532.1 hypothetical protein Iba_chr04bCG14260 [Ipomoea batatas]
MAMCPVPDGYPRPHSPATASIPSRQAHCSTTPATASIHFNPPFLHQTISPSPVTQGPAASTAAYPVATASSTAPPHLRRSPVTTPLLHSLPPNLQSSIRLSSPPATASKALAASTVVSAVATASSTTAPPVTTASSTTASPVDGHNRLAGIGRYKVNKWSYEKKSNKKCKQ